MFDIIKNRDIVIVGQQPWDIEIGSNCKNIALEFSKNNRVMYVNSALDRITAIRSRKDEKVIKRLKIIGEKKNGLVKIKANLWNLYPDEIIESINWVKNPGIYNFFNKINNKRFSQAIIHAITVLGFKDFMLFNDSDMFRSFYLKELLKPEISIYYSRDYLLATDYHKYHGSRLEPLLIEKSDLCVANSTYLTNYCKKYNSHSYYVGQGCDLTIFSKFFNEKNKVVPAEIENIKGSIIGYVGVLDSARLAIETLVNIAKADADWNLVMVGPEDECFIKSELHELKNVYFIGKKAPDELPAYINAFDVCINPQILNDFTIGNYPRKVDEYLAMGKPVVATRTDAMKVFEDFTYLANTKEDYPVLIKKAIAEDTADAKLKRKDFARTHTWANSVKEIYKAIANTEPILTTANYV